MSSKVITWPAPAGEAASEDYALEVGGTPVFVYRARVREEILRHTGLWTHRADCPSERAAFAVFDLDGPVTATVRPARAFRSAAVLPHRAGVAAEVAGGVIRFRIERPAHLTVVLDGSDRTPLHLFVGRPEVDVPRPDDPNVIYFGPGVHEVCELDIAGGKTVYLAGGAVVRAKLRPGEKGQFSDKWNVTFYSGTVFNVHKAENVTIRGRGILDGSLVPHPGRNLIGVTDSRNVRLEGIVLRDSPNWNVRISRSRDVDVEDLRLISGRLNSDGINSVNSSRVRVRRCFVRNHDDGIAVKTTEADIPAEDIAVEDCTLWSDWGYAMGVTYETRAPVRRVSYRRCDVLFARHWCLGVHVSDSATVGDVSFSDIEVSELLAPAGPDTAYASLSREPKLLRLVVSRDVWGKDEQRGRIRDILLDGVTVYGRRMPPSELRGFDAEHDVRGVTLRNVRLAGQAPAREAGTLALTCNAHVADVHVVADAAAKDQ